MYESHPNLSEPTLDSKLWRYMDVTKFLDILENQRLHMAPLISFNDPFEGHPPKSLISSYTIEPNHLSGDKRKEHGEAIKNNLQAFRNARNFAFASCWHINNEESAGMWNQYIRSGEGIAIQTTFQRIKQSITDSDIFASGALVNYVDYDTHIAEDVNLMIWAALKRKSFEHEKEFRLITLGDINPKGRSLKVDIKILIENVYIAPTTPDWVYNLIESILQKYGHDLKPIRSKLDDGPTYYVMPSWATKIGQ